MRMNDTHRLGDEFLLQAPDLSQLDALATQRRIRELAVLGHSDRTIAVLMGLDVNDVRRALAA